MSHMEAIDIALYLLLVVAIILAGLLGLVFWEYA